MQQINESAIALSDMVIGCDAKMTEAFAITSDLLVSNGHQSKRAILTAFEMLQSAFTLACDTANKCVALVLDADVDATTEERALLLARIADIQRKWSEMVVLVQNGIWTHGVIQQPATSEWMN